MSSLDSRALFDVKGKVVLVTGGSRGIGKMIAAGFVSNGAKVYISSRSAKDCETTSNELNGLGNGQCISIPADLQKLSEVERLVDEINGREKMLHVLVNNAGANWSEGIEDYQDSAFAKVMMLNLQRVFTLTQKCLPLLRAAAEAGGRLGSGWKDPARIIQIGSIDGLKVPIHDTFAYSSSKAGLHHLSRHFASKLGSDGITSNTIACGPFESKMMAQTLKAMGDVIINSVPLSRIGSPEDVAGTTLFLSSRAGAYVNGATITLDGGAAVAPAFGKL